MINHPPKDENKYQTAEIIAMGYPGLNLASENLFLDLVS